MTTTSMDEILTELRAVREQNDRIIAALERLAPKPLDLSMPLGGSDYTFTNRPLKSDMRDPDLERGKEQVRRTLDEIRERRREEG